MTSRFLLSCFVAHRALVAGKLSYLGQKGVAGHLAQNQRLVIHVEATLERLAAAGKVAA